MMQPVSRRSFLLTTAGTALAASAEVPVPAGQRRNVLLVSADMISARHLGCYGDPAGATPRLDALAGEGVVFEEGYCASTPCIPARACIMTGQYAHTHGKTAHCRMELDPCPPLLPEVLTRHGYNTAIVGKTHWWPAESDLGARETHLTLDTHLTPELGRNDAWIRFLEEKGVFKYNADTWARDRRQLESDRLPRECLKVNWTGDQACRVLERFAREDRPFFVNCSFVEPHGDGSVTREQRRKFADRPMRPIIGREGEHENKPRVQQLAVEAYATRYRRADAYRRGVLASMNLVDENIGKLLDKLDALGLRENTLVIFFSDHGDLMGDHRLFEKTFLYDAAVRIPYLVRGPGIPGGMRRRELVSQVDLFPTILGHCGIEDNGLVLEGRDWRPLFSDPNYHWRDTLFCEVDQTVHLSGIPEISAAQAKMVRRGPWKYIYTLVNGYETGEELYQLEDDPDELDNLAHRPEQAARCEDFRGEILRWLVATEVDRLHPDPNQRYKLPEIDRRYL